MHKRQQEEGAMPTPHSGIERCYCGHLPAGISPTGIYGGLSDPKLIGYDCQGCGTSKAIKWADATPEMRREARLVEMSRMAVDGLI